MGNEKRANKARKTGRGKTYDRTLSCIQPSTSSHTAKKTMLMPVIPDAPVYATGLLGALHQATENLDKCADDILRSQYPTLGETTSLTEHINHCMELLQSAGINNKAELAAIEKLAACVNSTKAIMDLCLSSLKEEVEARKKQVKIEARK